MMAPRAVASKQPWVDVTDALEERPVERSVLLRVVAPDSASPARPPAADSDPFAEVEV
jgi:hypothetical protein